MLEVAGVGRVLRGSGKPRKHHAEPAARAHDGLGGNRKEARRDDRFQERLETTFRRRFVLPPETDTGYLRAVFAKGILAVHASKQLSFAPKKIEITKPE